MKSEISTVREGEVFIMTFMDEAINNRILRTNPFNIGYKIENRLWERKVMYRWRWYRIKFAITSENMEQSTEQRFKGTENDSTRQ